jgi:uncharacterized protein YqjF (DUF2071 family)
MHPALRSLDHRPWPLPSARWTVRMGWRDLAFIHYPVEAAAVQSRLPSALRVDTFAGRAWLGLVPFRMTKVAPRYAPAFPFVSTFPEVNVRTYVKIDGKPGVWFFSLDADSRLTVFLGRHLAHLPYFFARATLRQRGDWYHFSSCRPTREGSVRARYRPSSAAFYPADGTFEHWATERYCLYTQSPRGQVLRLDVHHAPWPLQRAEAHIETCSLLSCAGLAPDGAPPLCHFSPGVEVISFSPALTAISG